MNEIINLMQLGMDGAARRQETIANNIANVDTPDYKRQDVRFIDRLQEAVNKRSQTELRTTSASHIESGARRSEETGFNTTVDGNTNYRNDKNNVDIDAEMALMAKNNLYYNTLSQQIKNKFDSLNNVIEKGGS